MRGWHLTLLRREARAGAAQLALFAFCVFLAALAVSVAVGWRASVEAAMASENKKSAGGDVVAFSTEPFSQALATAAQPHRTVRTTEMFTVALAPKTDRSLFSKLKAVEEGYPLYGELPLASGQSPYEVLKRGLIVEARVLERLGLEVGDELKVGSRTFSIADVALSEPDRPLGMFGVSPRVFIAHDQLESTGLVRPGSYLERRIHIRLPDPSQAESVAAQLREVAVPDQERVETWERPPVSMERFSENFFTFLDMMAVLVAALGGLGMQSTLSTWLSNRRQPIAILKTVGADRGFILRHYTTLVALTAGVAVLLGLAVAHVGLQLSGKELSAILPVQVTPALTVTAALLASFLCLAVAGAFSLRPLLQASGVRPATILRQEQASSSRKERLLHGLLSVAILYGLLAAMTTSPLRAAKVSVGLLVVLAACAFVAVRVVAALSKSRSRHLPLRTALGTWRDPASKSASVVFVLGTCLTILFTAVMMERALRQNWMEAVPPDMPNLLFLDIQLEHQERFEKFVGLPMEMTRAMRVRVKGVDGKPIDRSKKREYWERDARREFDASPTLELPENDYLVSGETLFVGDDPAQVSLRDDVAEVLEVKLGQTVDFTIQGVPVSAKVSSIRHSNREGFRRRFELLFPPALVEGAPQTLYARLRLDEEKVGPLQTRVAKEFPSIVSMDVSTTLRLVGERLFQMVGLIRYFLGAGLLAGAAILISAAWAARWDRLRESAYLKVLGANRAFLTRVVLYESVILGLLPTLLATALSMLTTYALCRWALEIPFPTLGWENLAMVLLPTLLVSALNAVLSRGVLATKPAPYLRD